MDEWGMGNILNKESLKADLRDFCLEKNIPYKKIFTALLARRIRRRR